MKNLEKTCNVREDWGYIEDNKWNFIPRVKEKYSNIFCMYRIVYRVDDLRFHSSGWKKLEDGELIYDDVFEVMCKTHPYATQPVYENLFVQFTLKNLEHLKPKNMISKAFKKCKPLDVILISYDSVSRVSWLQRLNKTNKFIFDKMKFEMLEGYNIVGDGTPGIKILFKKN